MCCENCPRYTSCEEEDHLNDLCCVSCPDYSACYGEDSVDSKGSDETEEDEDRDVV